MFFYCLVCEKLITQPYSIQIDFLEYIRQIIFATKNKIQISNYSYIIIFGTPQINTVENGMFLRIYLPWLVKIYRIEKVLPVFLLNIGNKTGYIKVYSYVVEAADEIFKSFFVKNREEKVGDRIAMAAYFVWRVHNKDYPLKKEEFYAMIDKSVEVMKWSEGIYQEGELKDNVKESELSEEELSIKKKEMFKRKKRKDVIMKGIEKEIYKYLGYCNEDPKEKEKMEYLLVQKMMKVVKKHISDVNLILSSKSRERITGYLISSSNDYNLVSKKTYKRFIHPTNYTLKIEYSPILYSCLSIPVPPLPYSLPYIVTMLNRIKDKIKDKEIQDGLIYEMGGCLFNILNDYLNIVMTIEKIRAEEEIEEDEYYNERKEINNEKDNEERKEERICFIVQEKKVLETCAGFKWSDIKDLLVFIILNIEMKKWKVEWRIVLRKLISFVFLHNSYSNRRKISSNEEEENKLSIKEKKEEMKEDTIIIRPLIFNVEKRREIFTYILSIFSSFSLFNIFEYEWLASEEKNGGCALIRRFLNCISGDIANKKKIGQRTDNIKKEELIEKRKAWKKMRRECERENDDEIIKASLSALSNLTQNLSNEKLKLLFKKEVDKEKLEGNENEEDNEVVQEDDEVVGKRKQESFEGKETAVFNTKERIMDIIEEEDLRECLLLFTQHQRKAGYWERGEEKGILFSILRFESLATLSRLGFPIFVENIPL